MGFTPRAFVRPVTTGMEMEAAAVLLESSERKVAKPQEIAMMERLPERCMAAMRKASCSIAPVSMTRRPRARPEAKRQIMPHMMCDSAYFHVSIGWPVSSFRKNMNRPRVRKM